MGGYFLLRCRTGLADCIKILAYYTEYAIKHDRTILLEFMMYSATDLNDVFDFSDYPCKIIVNPKSILEGLVNDNINVVPIFYKPQLLDPKDLKQTDNPVGSGYIYTLFNKRVLFPITNTFQDNILIVADICGAGIHNDFKYLANIKINNLIIDKFRFIRNNYSILYNSVHIRATDQFALYKDVSYKLNKVTNTYNEFIEKSNQNVFVATDDSNIINKLKDMYGGKILLSTTKYYNNQNTNINNNNKHHNNLHQFGSVEPDILVQAIIDLLLLAFAQNICIPYETSGFSRLAKYLCTHKNILYKMLESGNTINSPKIT
jgi:hypothetical protein